MARLNDIPPSAESLEALKRRFTRQNRDLARTNSAQSQRIRNLETEITRLIGENVSYREAAIAAQRECEDLRRRGSGGQLWKEEVREMRRRLEREARGLLEMAEEMDRLPEKIEKKEREKQREGRRRSTHGILGMGDVRSPDQKDWRNRQTLAGVLNGADMPEQDGRLPVILEDKMYPRRTLEPLELRTLVDANSEAAEEIESPDLGPPPIAHFDVADPINFDKENDESPNTSDEMVQLPSNLETRRKRRTSSLLKDMTSSDDEQQSEKFALFKSRAKRKLDVSDLEETTVPATSGSEAEDFVFQRRPTLKPASNKVSSRFARPNQVQSDIVVPTSPKKEKQEERKALAPKSANSPSKRPVLEGGKPEPRRVDMTRRKDTKQQEHAERPSGREGTSTTSIEISTGRPPSTEDKQMPPKTPSLPSDVLSPISSEPSATSTAHQPSEAAILNSVEDVLNGSIGRGSRRARAAVSYAEPSLRDKMRRPGREMVGAVEGIDGKRREGSIGQLLSRSTSEEVETRIKQEGSEQRGWKELPIERKGRVKEEPGSPTPVNDKPSTTLREGDKERDSERDRAGAIKRHAQARREQKALLHDHVSSNADTFAPSHSKSNVSEDREQLHDALDKLSIFDVPSSSPATDSQTIHVARKEHDPTESANVAGPDLNALTLTTTKKKAAVGVIGREAGRRHSVAPNSSSTPSSTSALSLASTSSSYVPMPREGKHQISRSTSVTGITARNASMPARPSSAASVRSQKSGRSEGLVGQTASGMGSGVVGRTQTQQQQQQQRQQRRQEGEEERQEQRQQPGLLSLEKENEKENVELKTERVGMRRRSMMV